MNTGDHDTILIQMPDGERMSEPVFDYFRRAGLYFDTQLNGFVIKGYSLPFTYAAFCVAHNLRSVGMRVPYDPSCFASTHTPCTA